MHRPLSVLTIHKTDTDRFREGENIVLCRCLSAMLADLSNRVALASELSLAADFYSDELEDSTDSSVHELPQISVSEYLSQTDRDAPVYRGFPEFPFISTCLMVAREMPSDCLARLQPLGTGFRDHNPFYGMVVLLFDISDLDQLRYGIVAFSMQPMIFVKSREMWRRWDEMGQELGGERELRVEEHRSRTPLSVQEFVAKFGVKITDDASALVSVPLVEPSAFRLIWPSDRFETGHRQVPQAPPNSRSSIDSSDVVLVQRIENILQKDGFTLSLLDGVRKLRSFQPSFWRLLREKPKFLHRPQAPGLLGLVFEAETYLNLIWYDGLGEEGIRDALDRDELKHIQSISLSLDKIADTPANLAETLCPSAMKHDLYILQSPKRGSDDRGTEFLQELCKVPDRISPGRRIVISGIYSSALRCQSWIPASRVSSWVPMGTRQRPIGS